MFDCAIIYFDDIDKRVDGAVLFSEEQAREIIEFAKAHIGVETLLIHCFGGLSRSFTYAWRAVPRFAI